MQYHSMETPKQEANSTSIIHSNNVKNRERYDMAKVIAVVGYFTLIGWFIAMVLYGKHKSTFTSFHLRQSLGLIITGALLSFIPLIGWLLNILVCLAWFYSLYHAIAGHQQKAPLLGSFYQEHLDFIK